MDLAPESLDSIMDGFKPSREEGVESQHGRTLGFWIDAPRHKKYVDLQTRSDGDFGERLKKLVFAAIDRAPLDV